MKQTATYESALFNQFLAFELRKAPSDIKGSIGRALVRFSPLASAQQQRDYIESIWETITDDDGNVTSDWPNRVATHH